MISFHSYLSNRLLSSDEKPVTEVEWNPINDLIAYGQSNGIVTIAKVILNNDTPGLYKILNIASLTTHKHEITALAWNSRFNKLLTGDRNGLVVLWSERESKWYPAITSSPQGSPVTYIATSTTGEYVVIGYENGRIYCGDIGSNEKWSTVVEEDKAPKILFWSASGKTLYYVDKINEMFTIKKHGKEIANCEIPLLDNDSEIVQCTWNHVHVPQLLVAYRNGDVILHTKGQEDDNLFLHCENLEITDIKWANSGLFFAVAGICDAGRCQVQFYSPNMSPIRTLNITSQNITSISFNRNDTQLVLSLDHSIAIAQLLPINMWDFFDNTIVYAVHQQFTSSYDVVFFNTITSETHVKSIDSLLGVAASKNSVVLASNTGNPETTLLVLNRQGIPLSSNFIQMESKLFAKTENFVIALSDTRICLWNVKDDETQFVQLDAEPSAVCAQGNKLFISFRNNELIAFELPSCNEIGKYYVGSHIEKISVSCDMTRISMVNIFGGLSFIDVHSGKIAGKPRKETWNMKWAEDSPDLFVALERQRLYVYFDFNAQEAINSLTYICRFNELEILSVDFAKLLVDPLNPKLEYFHTYETKLLRDIKLLTQVTESNINEEIIKHIRRMPHKRLWQIYGESAMMNGKYSTAEKAFGESQNQKAILFIKRMREIKSQQIQKGFCEWYKGNYDEAEKIFVQNDGKDFAVQMWSSLGRWDRVLSLKPENRIVIRAHKALADDYYNKGLFEEAADHFLNAESYSDAVRCYSQLGDAGKLLQLMNSLSSDSNLLIDIGHRFIELGACENAISTFLKAGEPNLAVSACVHLNHWTEALQLADQYKEISKQDLMGQYAHYLAENSQISRSIAMFVKFKLPSDAAQLLIQEGTNAVRNKDFLFAKKCFVQAAMLTQNTNKEGNVWYYAEAIHYFMLAHHYIYSGQYSDCIYPAYAATEYSAFLGEERTASLLALSGFYSRNFHQCSKGFITLEHSPNFTPAKQRKFKLVAVKIFGKNPPVDSKDIMFKCPKCGDDVSGLTRKCKKCGITLKRSIATGKPILSKGWRCHYCKHITSLSEVEDSKVCPLCHRLIKSTKSPKKKV